MSDTTRCLDDLRREHPFLGFALYAIDPADPVTLEIHTGPEVFAFTAPTEAEVIDLAFPPEVDPAPAIDIFA